MVKEEKKRSKRVKHVRVICDVHTDISNLCDEMICLDLNKASHQKMSLKKIKEIRELTEEARDMGQHMENRLKEYFEGISRLGFERDKDD